MSRIQFLASSRPLNIPEEIAEYNDKDSYDSDMYFSVHDTDEYWYDILKPIITMPYIYEAHGLDQPYFFVYLEKYMELGDVFELYEIPVQHWYEESIQRVLEKPEPILINIGQYTYQNQFGTYQLNAKKWAEELSHRTIVTEFGVTTIVKYD